MANGTGPSSLTKMWALRAFLLLLYIVSISSFSPNVRHNTQQREMTSVSTLLSAAKMNEGSRRAFFGTLASATAFSLIFPSHAGTPMVTTDEFLIILRDSARSIQRVEFSGPKSETVTVRLVDGTVFGIKDVIESSTDPRSPLKIQAVCRENGVPTKFANIESVLASSTSKKKVYSNQRVREAAEKEKEKQARIQKDEEERLAALYKLEQEEAQRALEQQK